MISRPVVCCRSRRKCPIESEAVGSGAHHIHCYMADGFGGMRDDFLDGCHSGVDSLRCVAGRSRRGIHQLGALAARMLVLAFGVLI